MLPISKEQYVRGVSRHRNSWHTKSQYWEGLRRLEEFCQQIFGHSTEKEIEEIIKSQRKQEGRAYRTLDALVGWMDERGLSPNTISGYMSVTKGYLRYNDVIIPEEQYKTRVKLPMKYQIPDELLTKETIQLLVQSKIDPRLKVLIYLLSSSGLRLQEALTLKMRDVELDEKPPRINLVGQFTKNGQPRETYTTIETAEAIKTLRRKPDEYIFTFMEGNDPKGSRKVSELGHEGYRIYMAEKKAGQMLRRITKNLGLDNKIEGHKFHVIHFHNFRKYFVTTATHFIGPNRAGLLAGHKQYMGMYDLIPKEELRGIYRQKLEEPLTILVSHTSKNDVDKLKERLDNLEKENAKLRNGVYTVLKQTEFYQELHLRLAKKLGITEEEHAQIVEEVAREKFSNSSTKHVKDLKKKYPKLKVFRVKGPIEESPINESLLEEIKDDI